MCLSLLVFIFNIVLHLFYSASFVFDYDCSDNQVQLKGDRNKLQTVQVPNIHSARCSLYSQVAIQGILGGASNFTSDTNTFPTHKTQKCFPKHSRMETGEANARMK